MIPIKKQNEPRSLLEYKKQIGAHYNGFPDKDELRESLMREQGYVCAYCMRRIPETRDLPSNVQPVTVEHWDAQSENDVALGLDYRNMFAVCAGNRGCGDNNRMTCDAHRGNTPLTVNPLKPDTLDGIYYKNGCILSTNPEVQKDLHETLNLNGPVLVSCRQSVLNDYIKNAVKKNHKTGSLKIFCERQMKLLLEANSKIPYSGIIIDWLKKHIR